MAETLVNNEGKAVDVNVVEGGADDPFAPKNQDADSPAVSPAGAAADAPVSKVDGEPATPATPATPAPAAVPTVTAAPANPVAAALAGANPAPADPVAADPAAPADPAALKAAPVEAKAQVQELGTWVETQRQEAAEEARRAAQSAYDRRAAAQETETAKLRQDVTDMRNAQREAEMSDMTEEEKVELRARFATADKSDELDTREASLVDYHKFLLIESYVMEFDGVGVTAEALEEFSTPGEMHAFCLEQKANKLEEQLVAAGTKPVAAAAPAEPAAPAAALDKPAVPAAAKASVDIGTGGGTGGEPAPNIGKGPAAMREALSNLKPEIVR